MHRSPLSWKEKSHKYAQMVFFLNLNQDRQQKNNILVYSLPKICSLSQMSMNAACCSRSGNAPLFGVYIISMRTGGFLHEMSHMWPVFPWPSQKQFVSYNILEINLRQSQPFVLFPFYIYSQNLTNQKSDSFVETTLKKMHLKKLKQSYWLPQSFHQESLFWSHSATDNRIIFFILDYRPKYPLFLWCSTLLHGKICPSLSERQHLYTTALSLFPHRSQICSISPVQ